MNQNIFFELLQKLKQKPNLMRKLKIFAVIGVVGFLITGGLVIWAGISAVSYVTSTTNQAVQSPLTQDHIAKLKTKAQGLPKIQALNCWAKAQSLLAVQPWLERPALDNLVNLKVACLEQKPAVCDGKDCEQIKDLMNTAEGRTI